MGETKNLGVVGSGQIGSGIAQLGAMYGLHVWLFDTDPAALSRASKSISSSVQRFVSREQLLDTDGETFQDFARSNWQGKGKAIDRNNQISKQSFTRKLLSYADDKPRKEELNKLGR
ncbi:3-hydroxyacyl-CoA dehydrogenase, NAD binding protein [Corchorus capsularis]|uniref:3-hydroxyacyl-CoA dehydrogenase, NAD binding protein n=1 Tax=Corchorus capsularis TaxID=210143 RepID=A0A1R3G0A9_COCAP|nr:3-hydroxyacyl-CoA dehydrogenase, NAD binding protein [Corchorus capsularis]